jgi:hypothetical protein
VLPVFALPHVTYHTKTRLLPAFVISIGSATRQLASLLAPISRTEVVSNFGSLPSVPRYLTRVGYTRFQNQKGHHLRPAVIDWLGHWLTGLVELQA